MIEGATSAAVREGANEGDDDDEERLVSSSSSSASTARILSVHEIDAHFLQRKLSSTVKDAATNRWSQDRRSSRSGYQIDGTCGKEML